MRLIDVCHFGNECLSLYQSLMAIDGSYLQMANDRI
jgi:hypothetical protein